MPESGRAVPVPAAAGQLVQRAEGGGRGGERVVGGQHHGSQPPGAFSCRCSLPEGEPLVATGDYLARSGVNIEPTRMFSVASRGRGCRWGTTPSWQETTKPGAPRRRARRRARASTTAPRAHHRARRAHRGRPPAAGAEPDRPAARPRSRCSASSWTCGGYVHELRRHGGAGAAAEAWPRPRAIDVGAGRARRPPSPGRCSSPACGTASRRSTCPTDCTRGPAARDTRSRCRHAGGRGAPSLTGCRPTPTPTATDPIPTHRRRARRRSAGAGAPSG